MMNKERYEKYKKTLETVLFTYTMDMAHAIETLNSPEELNDYIKEWVNSHIKSPVDDI